MRQILKDGFIELGLSCSELQLKQLEKYAELLVLRNKSVNLTGITDLREIAQKHFLDSASALCAGAGGKRIIDVGTGAGFPGLVLKILRPELELTLLDSLNKRLDFLRETVDALSLDNVTFIHSRAEDGGHRKELRESFDIAVSRAVAALPLLSELCLPFVSVGGSFLALKGPAAFEEAENAARAITILGGEIKEIADVHVPGTELEHKIVVIKKVRHTPIKLPRKPALISKNPIETCYNITKRPVK
ncbi:MAG: 16S rRNA (guanine(527)-N(7))-methyltransferase RsmG [Clostridia bacterium]|nr:16S rRNA (guanine(527)-N(7))-methyltransferase RsmG [Clostridia bacterium]